MSLLPVTARRLAFRVAFRVLRVFWLIRRPHHRGAKCVITRGDEVLLVRHTYGPRERWELPGGGVKRGERASDGARREAREELGVDLADWRPLGDLFERIDHKHDTLCCFHAEVNSLAVEIDRGEIAEASWFSMHDLPAATSRYVPRVLARLGT
jgi:8-oxo-dGTP pyrophosphatase MutT (NUDIX family)